MTAPIAAVPEQAKHPVVPVTRSSGWGQPGGAVMIKVTQSIRPKKIFSRRRVNESGMEEGPI
jgi:hypothetical protein